MHTEQASSTLSTEEAVLTNQPDNTGTTQTDTIGNSVSSLNANEAAPNNAVTSTGDHSEAPSQDHTEEMGNTDDGLSSSLSGTSEVSAPNPIDVAKKVELEERFQAIINNPRFWENPNRIKRLDDALVLPVYDDASMRMFYNSAKDELLEKEFRAAMMEKRAPVEIAESQIMELAEYKHHEKYVLEPQRKAVKEAKKKKNAA